MKTKIIICALFIFDIISLVNAQESSPMQEIKSKMDIQEENLGHRLDQLAKQVDDILWQQKIGDIAWMDKLYIYGPPPWKEKNPTSMSAGNPVKFWTYVFFPKNIDTSKKYPLILLPHGGIHADFTTYHTHIIRELVAQGYVVAAPEYRGSTGYGKDLYEKIDYGGRENDDVHATRNYMLDSYPFLDKNRVGIVGWSHGGMITLMNVFDYPDDYQVAFAGCPVSDLIARIGYQTQGYRSEFEAEYHIGQKVYDNVEEYKKRSPVWNTQKFRNTPLLIHSNTNDDDVNVLEVEQLIKSLKAEGKKFEYKIFKEVPGGHSFDRMDTREAKEIRIKIYRHLAKYLHPSSPVSTWEDIQKAGYRF
jgi:dipeptidyl aminopeptidase/acylaminoacyl peptidase